LYRGVVGVLAPARCRPHTRPRHNVGQRLRPGHHAAGRSCPDSHGLGCDRRVPIGPAEAHCQRDTGRAAGLPRQQVHRRLATEPSARKAPVIRPRPCRSPELLLLDDRSRRGGPARAPETAARHRAGRRARHARPRGGGVPGGRGDRDNGPPGPSPRPVAVPLDGQAGEVCAVDGAPARPGTTSSRKMTFGPTGAPRGNAHWTGYGVALCQNLPWRAERPMRPADDPSLAALGGPVSSLPGERSEHVGFFEHRHIGTSSADRATLLAAIGYDSLGSLLDDVVPAGVRDNFVLDLHAVGNERELLAELRALAGANRVLTPMIGLGFYDTVLPAVLRRLILENPAWYTSYTPYQAEIAQGRLEALLIFQTMVADLTELPVANASLLDEATAAVEAMFMCQRAVSGRRRFVVDADCFPQTIAVLKTRAEPLDIEIVIADLH